MFLVATTALSFNDIPLPKLITPIQKNKLMNPDQIKQDWNSRGYSFGVFRDPPGRVWADFVHRTDELVVLAKARSRWRLQARLCDPGLEKRSLYQQMQFTRSGTSVRVITYGTMDIDLHVEQFVEKMVALGIKLNLNKT